jgi:hypothetical protein
MLRREWFLSLLIACHLVAITLAAIPRPASRPLEQLPRTDHDPVAAVLQPPLTSVAGWMDTAQREILRATRRVRAVTRPYVAAGLPQNWNMFSSVLTMQRYVRMDYYVDSPTDGRPTVFRQLVLPSQPEGVPRLSYRSADKAVRVAMGLYLARLGDEEAYAAEPGDETPNAARLAPLVRHFRSQFSEDRGIPLQQIARIKVWTGAVVIPEPGTPAEYPAELRRAMLAKYRQVAINPAPWTTAALWSTQDEADITWQLVYIEEP